jgi:microcompartment protein CcmL/EutN
MVILDAMEKSARVRVLQAELNDQPGVCLKLTGDLGDVQSAAQAAQAIAEAMRVPIVADVIARPDPAARPAYEAAADFNALFEQATVQIPPAAGKQKEKKVSQQSSFAVGLIETQGFTAVFEAIDTAVKTAAVEVLAREKLGGGYITVLIKGDVAAVTAAVEAGKARVDGLGKLIAAHVIPSPSQAVLSLLPKL